MMHGYMPFDKEGNLLVPFRTWRNNIKMCIRDRVQTMMPKLHSTNFEGMELIRPLYLVREDDIKAVSYTHLYQNMVCFFHAERIRADRGQRLVRES